MTRARDLSKLLGTANNGVIPNSNLGVSFENISDSGTAGTKVASGTTNQRGSTAGQITYNTDNNALEVRNNSTFVALESPLGLISVSPIGITPANNAVGGNQITLTGNNFKSGATVKFIGNDGTEFNATSVSFTNSSTLIATAPTLTEAKEPFDVKVINPSGNFAQLDNQIQINTSPVWQTASGTLATIDDTATGTHATISATDIDGGDTISYSESTNVLSGAGLTLNSSTGAISGNPTNVDNNTTYTFGINASDGTDIVNRSFNIIVNKVLDGSTIARANTSAQSLYSLGITTNGIYYITNSSSTIPVWCDFSQGEGYMLAISVNTANPLTADVWNTSSGSDNEIQIGDASPQARDVVSQLRRNRVFQKLMFKYENAGFSPTTLYRTNPVIYDNGSNVGAALTALPENTLINRASGNTGRLPDTVCGNMAAENLTRIRINSSILGARPTKLSNYDINHDNQAGFFQYAGQLFYGANFEGGCNSGDTTKFELYIK